MDTREWTYWVIFVWSIPGRIAKWFSIVTVSIYTLTNDNSVFCSIFLSTFVIISPDAEVVVHLVGPSFILIKNVLKLWERHCFSCHGLHAWIRGPQTCKIYINAHGQYRVLSGFWYYMLGKNIYDSVLIWQYTARKNILLDYFCHYNKILEPYQLNKAKRFIYFTSMAIQEHDASTNLALERTSWYMTRV